MSSLQPRALSPEPTALRRGLTLIEILVSVTILATAVVLIMQAFVRGAYMVSVATHRLNAYAFSSAKMADLELSVRQGFVPEPRGRFRMGQDQYEWHVEIVPSIEDPELETLTLTVGWRQGPHAYETSVSTLKRVVEQGS